MIWAELAEGPIGGLGWLGDLSLSLFEAAVVVALGVLVVAVVAEGWALLYLLRRYGTLLHRLPSEEKPRELPDGLPIGVAAPAFELQNLGGRTWTLERLLAQGRQVMLVFTDTSCGHCHDLLPELGRWQSDYSDIVSVVPISGGAPNEIAELAKEHGLERVLVSPPDKAVRDLYEAQAVPAAVIIFPGGLIDSKIVFGPPSIRELIESRVDRTSDLTNRDSTSDFKPSRTPLSGEVATSQS